MVRREGEVESAVSCAPLYGLSISVDEGGGDGADVVGLEGLGGEARGAVASAIACPRLEDNTVQVADELEASSRDRDLTEDGTGRLGLAFNNPYLQRVYM